MRVVYLTTEFPWPATSGGPVRTLSQLRIVSSLPEVDQVTLLSVTETKVPDRDVRDLEKAVPKLRVVPPIFHPIHLFDFKKYVPRVVALRVLKGVPYLAAKWDSRKLRATLRRELVESAVDVVYIDHLGMAVYLPDMKAERPGCRTVLDQHNVESDFFKQFAEEKTGVKKIVATAEHRTAAKFEERVLREVNAVVAISHEDAKHFDKLAGVNAHVVPVVMSFDRKARASQADATNGVNGSNGGGAASLPKPHFCYVGSLRWKPNVLGLDWFCQKVWPLIRKHVPNATLEIAGVGLKPDPATGKLPVPDAWRVPGVTTVGFLEDLEPLYDRSIGMVAPITGGSGVRLKLLEGFRAGMPVVTTPDGAFGLPLTDGKEALISADADGFAARAFRVVNERDLRVSLRDEGYAFLEKHHSLAVAQNIMRGALGIPIPPK